MRINRRSTWTRPRRSTTVALQAAGAEPEPRLLFGLVLLKTDKDRDKATQHFETVKSELPDRLLPYAALAWLRMEKRAVSGGRQ